MLKKPIKITKIVSPSLVKAPNKKSVAKPHHTSFKPQEKPRAPEHSKISKVGFVDGLSDEFYHGDCCIGPSMSSSMAKVMDEECPKKMWSTSYLDPNREKEENKNFDFGHALHKIFLEPNEFENSISEIKFDEYRKDEAKAQRVQAYQKGKIPLLTKDLIKVFKMREALMDDPTAKKAFTKGIGERSYFAKDKETGIWIKARVDWDMFVPRICCDYKGMDSANPIDFEKSIWNYGYYIQQPWYQEVIQQATGELVDEFYFIVQEKKYPFLVSVIEIKPEAIEWGAKIMRRSIRKFADCLDKGQWPGYRDIHRPDDDGIITVDLPQRSYFQLEERDQRGDFDANS